MGWYYGVMIPLAAILGLATAAYMAKSKEDVGTGGVIGAFSFLVYIGIVFLLGALIS